MRCLTCVRKAHPILALSAELSLFWSLCSLLSVMTGYSDRERTTDAVSLEPALTLLDAVMIVELAAFEYEPNVDSPPNPIP